MHDSVRLQGPSHRSSFLLLLLLLSLLYFFCCLFFCFALVLNRVPTCVWKFKTNAFDESITPADIYLLKVNSRNTRASLNLTIKKWERQQWSRSGVFIVNFKQISPLVLVFLLLTLNTELPAGTFLDWFFWVVLDSFRPILHKFRFLLGKHLFPHQGTSTLCTHLFIYLCFL